MKIITRKFFRNITKKPEELNVVKEVLKDVELYGDTAVDKYTKKFDSIELENFVLSKKQIKKAYSEVNKDFLRALKYASQNITTFSKAQFNQLKGFEISIDRNVVGQRVIPLKRAGCYIPGGLYPLFSTALMCIIPAKIAGVKEVIVCSPKIKNETIVAADIAGADEIYNIGGIQAIGAMTFGTQTLPKVDKIVGPGNKYVASAKKEVYGSVGIDFIAGPTEILIVADKYADPSLVASDLLAEAEHDIGAGVWLVTTSKKLALAVNREAEMQLMKLKTKTVAEQSIKKATIIVVDSLKEAAEVSNEIAPEHLELLIKNPKYIESKLVNYGSMFVGERSSVVFGDYCSGTNHVLPTNGAAKFTGGLSVRDFVKIVTFQKIGKVGSKKLAKIASKLASIEGLDAHRRAAEARLYIQKKNKVIV